MRPKCDRCGASNRHIDEFVSQLWQCSACGMKNQHFAPVSVTAPEEVEYEPECVACDSDGDECSCNEELKEEE